MVNLSVEPAGIACLTWHGDLVRADLCGPADTTGSLPVPARGLARPQGLAAPDDVDRELRVESMQMSVPVCRGYRPRLGVSGWHSPVADTPSTRWYGQMAGTGASHPDLPHSSRLGLHARTRAGASGDTGR